MSLEPTWAGRVFHAAGASMVHKNDSLVSTMSRELSVVCDDDEIAYFTVRWKTRAGFVYRTKKMR